jgi:hypothetical protein
MWTCCNWVSICEYGNEFLTGFRLVMLYLTATDIAFTGGGQWRDLNCGRSSRYTYSVSINE